MEEHFSTSLAGGEVEAGAEGVDTEVGVVVVVEKTLVWASETSKICTANCIAN